MWMTCIKQLEEGNFFRNSKCDTTHPSIQPFHEHNVQLARGKIPKNLFDVIATFYSHGNGKDGQCL
jgi:hypothetical protein